MEEIFHGLRLKPRELSKFCIVYIGMINPEGGTDTQEVSLEVHKLLHISHKEEDVRVRSGTRCLWIHRN